MDLENNSGVIFKNAKKPEGSKQPDYRGEINVDGAIKEVALWVRESKDGKKYFSVKVSEPYRPPVDAVGEADETDLPF